MPAKEPNLDAAYGLETPQDNLRLYADWAGSYDRTFAAQMDYQMPQAVATIFGEMADPEGPVLDVGAGTGLVGLAISKQLKLEIDALDLSPDMLVVAAGKGVYRRTIEANLNETLQIPDATYSALVSAGTFTHGHVGPGALDELLRVARKGAKFVIGINKEHFVARGFEAKFHALEPEIKGLELRSINIYGADAVAAHKDDQALVAVFSKA